MINLAGNPECDQHILLELKRCGIEAVHGDPSEGEVPAKVTGKLGPFTFRRAWYYWVAEGLVPLAVARELYSDPAGKTDIHVNGDCDCPEPDESDITWMGPTGHLILSLKEKTEAEKRAASNSVSIREAGLRVLCDYDFSDEPSADGKGFIDLYHIDSELGLRIFADAIKRHGLDKEQP